jgi:hypothetical protein
MAIHVHLCRLREEDEEATVAGSVEWEVLLAANSLDNVVINDDIIGVSGILM